MRQNHCRTQGAFTLIELILLMALIIIAASLVTPRLAQFFGGRTLDSEVRRFVALTHYAQSRAVSEGVPMMLWIDTKKGAYGLQQEAGYTDKDTKSVDYKLDKDLKINVGSAGQAQRTSVRQPTRNVSKTPAIYFATDGSIERVGSVSSVSIQRADKQTLWLVPSANWLSYEIQTQNARR